MLTARRSQEKGGDPQQVRNSESKRGSKPELVDDVLERYKLWTQGRTTLYVEVKS